MTGDATRTAPPTEEGWYALHDLRTIDWDAWRAADDRDREAAIEEGREYLRDAEAVADAADGDSAAYAVLGQEADLMFVHLRPATADLDALQRRFEHTALAEFTERAGSYVSVTEASGYTERAREYFEGEVDDDSGLARYIRDRLHPEIPDDEHVSFYPMSKRRDPEQNWYDLPFEERAEHMERHGSIGREYGGQVQQMITGSIGLDDFEWGVTLWADDLTDVKDLLYEMRFDPSSSRFADFGPFYVGRRFAPADLDTVLAGERLPAYGESDRGDSPHGDAGGEDGHPHGDEADGPHGGDHPHGDAGGDDGHPSGGGDGGGRPDVRGALEAEGVYGGEPHGEDVYAVVLYSEADVDELAEEVDGLRSNFDHYDRHVRTAVYGNDDGPHAVASVWEAREAADTASGFLSDLPGIVRQAGDDSDRDTWGTMGMFYTVEPEYREDFVAKFEEVGGLLAGMDGHVETDLLANVDDENDMFIASRWESKDDAMAFFRSQEFSETVEWGRDVLADRPRHVFLR